MSQLLGTRRVINDIICVECPNCGTDYNRKALLDELRKLSPSIFEFHNWTTRFKCQTCRENVIISSSSDDSQFNIVDEPTKPDRPQSQQNVLHEVMPFDDEDLPVNPGARIIKVTDYRGTQRGGLEAAETQPELEISKNDNPLPFRFCLECNSCKRVYIPGYNAGITPLASAAIETVAKEHSHPLFDLLAKHVQACNGLPAAKRIKQLAGFNLKNVPDIVYGGTAPGEPIKPLNLNSENFRLTEATATWIESRQFHPEQAAIVRALPAMEREAMHDRNPGIMSNFLQIQMVLDSSRYWKCNSCSKIQASYPVSLVDKDFFGSTVDEAQEKLKRELPIHKIVLVRTVRSDQTLSTENIRMFQEPGEALLSIQKSRADTAHTFALLRIDAESKMGSTTIEATNEEEAKTRLAQNLEVLDLAELKITKLHCEIQPRSGIMGFWKKPGTWKFDWMKAGRYHVSYTLWPMITATCVR